MRNGDRFDIVICGPSLVSARHNTAATYFRGLLRALHGMGHSLHYIQPHEQQHDQDNDMADPPWVKLKRYHNDCPDDAIAALRQWRHASFIIVAGISAEIDQQLQQEALRLKSPETRVLYWDVHPSETLARLSNDPHTAFAGRLRQFDGVLTCGGGEAAQHRYETAMGVRSCQSIAPGVDTTTHFPVNSDPRYWSDMVFMGNRLLDRERRVEEFLLIVADCLTDHVFLLAGSGWESRELPRHVIRLGHIPPREHNALHCSATMVLDISRETTAVAGHCPSTRLFEAAGAGACVITDSWQGIEAFFMPGREVLVARNGAEVVHLLETVDRKTAQAIGSAARQRVLGQHTYEHRATELHRALRHVQQAVAARQRLVPVSEEVK